MVLGVKKMSNTEKGLEQENAESKGGDLFWGEV